MQILAAVLAIALLWLVANGVYQILRKPAELLSPVSGTLSKTPAQIWRQYAALFRAHSTPTMTPELLAGLAQVEGAGDPLAHTYWRWQWSWNPFKWYQPASSAVGMYQITDGTFLEAKRYCIHDHLVAQTGAWSDPHGCWFNALYTRVIPTHAVEMTSALLDHQVHTLLAARHVSRATPDQERALAAIVHLCGPGGGDLYVRQGFRTAGLRCGDQDAAVYLKRVTAAVRQFASLAHGR